MKTASDQPEIVLEAHDLTVSYHRKPALWDVDFKLPAGKLIGIVGPNGAGKSTLIKASMDLIPAASGYVRLFGKSIDEVRNRVSYVPQRESVDWDFPASALDVVMMGRYGNRGLFKRMRAMDRRIAMENLHKVELGAFANRQISQLSGGQQQRIFLARALAQEADLYLMDEPFAGIDAGTESVIVKVLEGMRDDGKTIVVVHHDLQTAQRYFDWFILLNTRLVACGPRKDVFTRELLQETYGGKLTLLDSVHELARTSEAPLREG